MLAYYQETFVITREEIIQKTNEALAREFELSPEQAPPTAAALESAGLTAAIIRDLCGRDRFVAGQLP